MRQNIGDFAKWGDICVGRWVYLDSKTAEYLDDVFKQFGNEHRAFEGCYEIVDVDTSFKNDPNVPEVAQVKATIYLSHKYWDKSLVEPIPVVINPHCSIILAGALLLTDCIRTVVASTRDLIEINKNRFDCVGCGEPLNIVTANLRICNECESNLSED